MSTTTPTALVRMLHLSPGIDAESVDILSPAETSSTEFISALREIFSHPSNELATAFWTEFAAICLPCLLRTFVGYDMEGRGSERDFTAYANILAWSLGTPSGPRLVRELQKESIDAYYKLLRWMEYLCDRDIENTFDAGDADHIKILDSFFTLLDTFTYTLAFSVPSVTDLPHISRPTLLNLQSLWSGWLAGLSQAELGLVSHLTLVKLLMDEDDLISLRNYYRKRGVSWFSCEVLGLTKEAARTVKAGPCKKIIVGEVMSACGRCQSVRYCSQEHQAVDWKRHKKTCFEQQW
ncbi:hypothetical protein BDY24DRAFT_387989 [Mrakia frigida]|uniref:zinc finger MYND domain-containing protein n=1 Tax=Mrakia frigida TaxID=29902 RepID=UPI003FCC1F4F